MQPPFPSVWKKYNCSEEKNQWGDRKINQRIVPRHQVGVKAESKSDQTVARELFFASQVNCYGNHGDCQDSGERFGRNNLRDHTERWMAEEDNDDRASYECAARTRYDQKSE